MKNFNGLPPEKLSFKRKNKEWRRKHVDWAEDYVWSYDSKLRKPLKNKLTNYRLINGHLDMEDISLILNPTQLVASYIPDKIQHYPIINSKLNVLSGEELSRRFDYRVIVTNPEAMSEIEETKKNLWLEDLSKWATQESANEEEAMRDLEKIEKYHKYSWKDIREIRGNCLLNHYSKELSFKLKFNRGFYDAMIVGEEAYQCDIVGGEPIFEKIDPNRMIVINSGSSNRIEDADMIILWDYWSPGKIIDTYYDVLKDKDIKYIDNISSTSASTDDLDNIDPRKGFSYIDSEENSVYGEGILINKQLSDNNISFSSNHVDDNGNIRVIRLYWKSYRKILRVKSYDLETGEEEYNFYPENYIVNEDLGEEAFPLWINEAWEGTKIGDQIYVNMRPRVIQYNRLSNPSKCHFGIIGSVYNVNGSKPFSLVDMAKPYNYYYNVIHDRLNKNLAANVGKLMPIDFANIPKGWDIEKLMYFAKMNKILVKDSFKEGNKGQSTGKLAGMLNNQSSVIDADQSAAIQNDINLLNFIKMEMAEVIGISPQREGQVSNRETVGGVERSVLQSSHITEWIFSIHDDIKKRALECFLETAKIAMKGKSKKFNYLMSDGEMRILEISGDDLAEADYGLVVDNSDDIQTFIQKMEMHVQALIQNQMVSTKTLFKLWNGSSVADITRSIEEDERYTKESQAKAQEDQNAQAQADLEMREFFESEKLRILEENNIRDNETKLLLKEQEDLVDIMKDDYDPQKREELLEKIRQHNDNIKLKKSELELKTKVAKDNKELREKEINLRKLKNIK